MFGKIGRILSAALALIMMFSCFAGAEKIRADVKLDSVYGAFSGAFELGIDELQEFVQIFVESDLMEELLVQIENDGVTFGNEDSGYTEIDAYTLGGALGMVFQSYVNEVPLEKGIRIFEYYNSESYYTDSVWMNEMLSEELNMIAYLAMNMGLITMYENGDMEINVSLEEIDALAKEYLPMLLENKEVMDEFKALSLYEVFKEDYDAVIEKLEKVAYQGESLFADTNAKDFGIYAKLDAKGFITAEMMFSQAEPASEWKANLYSDISGTGFRIDCSDEEGTWSLESSGIDGESSVLTYVKKGADGDETKITYSVELGKMELLADVKNEEVVGNVRLFTDYTSKVYTAEFVGEGEKITLDYELDFFPFKENLDILCEQDGNEVFTCKLNSLDENMEKYSLSAAWDRDNGYALNAILSYEEAFTVAVMEGTLEKKEGEIKYSGPFSFKYDMNSGDVYLKYEVKGENYLDSLLLDLNVTDEEPFGTISYMSSYNPENEEGGYEITFSYDNGEAKWAYKAYVLESGLEFVGSVKADGDILKIDYTYNLFGEGIEEGSGMMLSYSFEYNLLDETCVIILDYPMMNLKIVEKINKDGLTVESIGSDGKTIVYAEYAKKIDENGIVLTMNGEVMDETIDAEFGAVKTDENAYCVYYRTELNGEAVAVELPVVLTEEEDGMNIAASLSAEEYGIKTDIGTLTVDITVSEETGERVSGTPMEVKELAEIIYGYLTMLAE